MAEAISHPRRPPTVFRNAGFHMLYKTLSAAVYGVNANIIEVEVDVSGAKLNEDYFHTVGLPDAAVRESRDRDALKNCGYDIPRERSRWLCRRAQHHDDRASRVGEDDAGQAHADHSAAADI